MSLIRRKVNDFFGFNLVFFIAFIASNFLFPVFVYPLFPEYGIFNLGYDSTVVSKCTALSTVAFCLYIYGYSSKIQYVNTQRSSWKINALIGKEDIISKCILFLTVFTFLLYLLFGGLQYNMDRYIDSNMSSNPLFVYNYVVFAILTVLVNYCLFITTNTRLQFCIIVISLLISLILLFVGSRTIPISALMVIFYWFSKKYKLSVTSILIALVGGVLIMYVVGKLRTSGINSESLSSFSGISESEIGALDALSDLIGVNRNNFLTYSYVQNHSITYGLTLVGNVLAAIPFAANIFCSITGAEPYTLGSASFLTYQEFGKNPPMGVGSNIVADVYLAFGFIGVIVIFYCFGRFVAKAINQTFKAGSLKWSLILIFLISDAVFINRGMILEVFRPIVWSYIIVLLINRITNAKYTYASSFKSRNNSKML